MNYDNCDNAYYKETKKTCPECGGSGKDNASLDWKCYYCDGLGKVSKEKYNDYYKDK